MRNLLQPVLRKSEGKNGRLGASGESDEMASRDTPTGGECVVLKRLRPSNCANGFEKQRYMLQCFVLLCYSWLLHGRCSNRQVA